jgi:predicted RNA-binding Zn ribbon-like protein
VLPDPGDRAPAPDALRPIQAFVNTLDMENDVEELSSPAALAAALERARLAAPGLCPTDADLRAALDVREALRALLLANNGVPVAREALVPLERAARAGQLAARFSSDGGAELVAEAPGVDGALGRLVALVVTARADGSLERLKACRRDVCHWAFYDRSRNRSSHWCAMSVCGNRTKTKAYRSRRAADP